MADPPYDATLTPKPLFHQLADEDRLDRAPRPPSVYAFTPTPSGTESGLKAHSSAGDAFMSGHGRGGTDQTRPGGSSTRRQLSQASQQRRQQTPGYPSLIPPPESPTPYQPPLYATANVQYPPHRSGYPGQYMMSPQPPLNMAHTPPNVFPYPPTFHVPDQSQSIHAGYPTIASYPQYQADPSQYSPPQSQASPSPQQPSPVFTQSFRYPSPMSPAYPPYPQQSPSFSPPPPMFQHQQHVYPGGNSYSQYTHQHHSPGAQEGEGGTWWYVPSRLTPQYEGSSTSAYPFYPQNAPAQQQADGGEYGGGESAGPSHPASPSNAARAPTPSSSSAASPAQPGARDRSMVRRPYHPNPPAHRSDWVMWAGNVPSDAVHDELWRFFTRPLEDNGASGSSSSGASGDGGSETGERNRNGVLSIFLISRSSCAFVNYETEADLETAISRFNGVPLRADPRCARLVCRVRRKDDDLRAGVGGQRGSGMHTRWVKAKQKTGPQEDAASSDASSSHSLEPSLSGLSIGSSEEDGGGPSRPPPRPHAAGSSGSESRASTNSSLLRQHFPQRYFILKSLTQDDLDISVQRGLWATQKHNEGILDRAFRTSKDVFLIFSVNKSGEFYGYARMAGTIGQGDGGPVTWSRRNSAASVASNASWRGLLAASGAPSSPSLSPAVAALAQPAASTPHLLSGDRHVEHSPQPYVDLPTDSPELQREHDAAAQSAPAVLGRPHRHISKKTSSVKGTSLDHGVAISQGQRSIKLDESAPFRAMRSAPQPGKDTAIPETSHERRESVGTGPLGPVLEPVTEETGEKDNLSAADPNVDGLGVAAPREEGWGQDFKLQWLCIDRLPFQRTRNIRNPWNHDREVKVSRDGTELEPSVGQALLEEWRQVGTEAGSSVVARSGGAGGGGSGSNSRS
ncbi:YT521-B-like domain-containing protein [Favolaschia claudopus]|uniref:YT521-B-like domain-containing protein n=1 Tax=Favolaschia claudopus TaxID=2862362 RepID=A0AAW0B9F1_9AGAR